MYSKNIKKIYEDDKKFIEKVDAELNKIDDNHLNNSAIIGQNIEYLAALAEQHFCSITQRVDAFDVIHDYFRGYMTEYGLVKKIERRVTSFPNPQVRLEWEDDEKLYLFVQKYEQYYKGIFENEYPEKFYIYIITNLKNKNIDEIKSKIYHQHKISDGDILKVDISYECNISDITDTNYHSKENIIKEIVKNAIEE